MSLTGWTHPFSNENLWENDTAPHEKPHCAPSSSLLGMALFDVEGFARNQFGRIHAAGSLPTGNSASAATEHPVTTENIIFEVLRDINDVLEEEDPNTYHSRPAFEGARVKDPRQFSAAPITSSAINRSSGRHGTMLPVTDTSGTPFQYPAQNGLKRTFNNVYEEQAISVQPSKRQRTSNGDEEFQASQHARRFRTYQMEQWADAFEELLYFLRMHEHCQVPHAYEENPALARWVKRQRYQYKLLKEGKPSTMTQERIKALEDIGFIWDSHNSAWEERVAELRRFKKRHGHCNVPSSYKENMRLATWVKCQRRQYKLFWQGKASNITLERIEQLQELGFEWSLRGKRT
jgi:hypothetical protein